MGRAVRDYLLLVCPTEVFGVSTTVVMSDSFGFRVFRTPALTDYLRDKHSWGVRDVLTAPVYVYEPES